MGSGEKPVPLAPPRPSSSDDGEDLAARAAQRAREMGLDPSDRLCLRCNIPFSARTTACVVCGGPLAGGAVEAAPETPAATPSALRLDRLEADVAALARVQILATQGGTLPPPSAERPSLPVQAARRGYVLGRAASAVVGILYAVAELMTEESLLRVILRLVFE